MIAEPRPWYALSKRVFDIIVSGTALLVALPLLALVALLVRLDSSGPLIYRGRRTGRYGVPFDILKFRTMVVDAERAGTTTSLGDPRITKVGQALRLSKLDELPQLWNVLTGTMSLVGPRPEVEEHTREYSEEERAILDVPPGITDYSSIRFVNLAEQLGGDDAHHVFLTRIRPEKNRLRLEYVRRRSWIEDLKILAGTCVAVLRHATRRRRERGTA